MGVASKRVTAALAAFVAAASAGTLAGASPGAPAPGGVIVFSCSGCMGVTGPALYTVSAAGGAAASIPNTEGAYWPSWSPGRRFVSYSANTASEGELWRRAANGTQGKRLTSPWPAAEDSAPAWSPDGRTILFTRAVRPQEDRGGSYRTSIWRIASAGGAPRPVYVPRRTNVFHAAWSPDGRRIAVNDVGERLWVAASDGSGRRRLHTPRGRIPHWSPDGKRLAYVDLAPPPAGSSGSALAIADVRTGRTRRLPLLKSSNFGSGVAWSPDGRWLAASQQRPRDCEAPVGFEACALFEIVLVRVSDGRTRVVYRADYGELYGLDWR